MPAATPATTVGPYEIEALLGRGGMAEVFRGRIREGRRAGWPVAVKRLIPEKNSDPIFVQLFLSEGELSRQLAHPNVVEVYDTGALAGQAYIAMELVEGRDLAQILARCKELGIRLPVDFCCFLTASVASGLHHAHTALGKDGIPLGIVHCDVSPSNVFVSRTGEIKLGDFGVARAARGSPSEAGYWGKMGYISPEQLRGDPVSPLTDVFSLGVVLYELLTGERAFPGTDPDFVLREMKKGPKRPSSLREGIPGYLDEAVLDTLAVKPGRRTPDAAVFAEALSRCFDARIGNPLAIAAVVRGLFELSPAPRPASRGPGTATRRKGTARRGTQRRGQTRPASAAPAPALAPTPTPVPVKFVPLLPLLGRLHRERATTAVLMGGNGPVRHLFIRKGELSGARSSVPAERIGALLVAEGKIASADLERLAAQAKSEGKVMGQALIEAGVLTAADLATLLERQAIQVLRGALRGTRMGALLPPADVHAVGHRMIGAAVVDAYRDGAVELGPLVWPARIALAEDALATVGLKPAEAKTVNRLGREPPPAPGTLDPALERVLAALLELGLLER